MKASAKIPEFKFHHLYDEFSGSDERGQRGVVTIATQLHKRKFLMFTEKTLIFYGISICSNTDNFSKKIGNRLAIERLQLFDSDSSSAYDYNGVFEFNLELKQRSILFFLLMNILSTKIGLPEWALQRIKERAESESYWLFKV